MNDRLFELMQVTASLQHEFNLLQNGMSGAEWFELTMRDREAAELRKQNQLQEYIRNAKQIIAERLPTELAVTPDDFWSQNPCEELMKAFGKGYEGNTE